MSDTSVLIDLQTGSILEDHAAVEHAVLHKALTAMMSHPRCRLPFDEVRRRLSRYAQQAGVDD